MFEDLWRLNYTESDELEAQLLELPYIGDHLSMIIILPRENEGLPILKSKLNQQNLRQELASMKQVNVEIHLPKFKVEQTYDLNDVLKCLGFKNVFSDDADFSGINGFKYLKVSDVIHKVVIEVDEKGTEAAAATGIRMTPLSLRYPPVFKANHPFLYLIRDKRNDVILFLGQINKL